ncbi:MAG: hypothetical protein HY549_09640 [Elusimicrobia bacterium]|nr:hypothetical protein [Elusimicrobiota bacterium]
MNGEARVSEELLIRWIGALRRRRYYGKVVLCWEDGRIMHVKMEETLTMQDLQEGISKAS